MDPSDAGRVARNLRSYRANEGIGADVCLVRHILLGNAGTVDGSESNGGAED